MASTSVRRRPCGMTWILEWYGVDTNATTIFRIAEFETLKHAHEYISLLAGAYQLNRYDIRRIGY